MLAHQRRRQQMDLHEAQKAMLAEEMQEEARAKGGGASTSSSRQAVVVRPVGSRAAPPRGREPFQSIPPSQPYGGEPPAVATPRTADASIRRNDSGHGLDVHELLKNEAFASDSAACDNHFEKSRPCPADVFGISDQYVVLDSFHKVESSDVARGQFKWNFMVQGQTGDQDIGVHDKVDNVIEIQVGTFSIPILPEVPYVLRPAPVAPTGTNQLVLVHNNSNPVPPLNPLLLPAQYPPFVPGFTPWISNPYTQLPCGNRLTVQYEEAGQQSYSDANGARHHFEFVVAYEAIPGENPNMLQAMPLFGRRWDSYVFTEPLQDVAGMTLRFRNPDNPVRFEPDCLYDVSVAEDGAAAPGPFLAFTYPGHGLLVGDRVFVRGFRSGVNALDVYLNRPEGHVVSGDPSLPALAPSTPIPTPDTFWLDPAVSTIDLTAPPPALPQLVTVCIAKRRLRIPVRLRRIVQRLTNYMAPVS